MKLSFITAAVIAVISIAFFSCQIKCDKVTGPNDISYTEISTPDCSSSIAYNATYLINSASDFNAMCPGSITPTAWDFTNKTYFVFGIGYGDTTPYIAGVGTNPSDSTKIIVTIGIPCNTTGISLDEESIKAYTLELAKTTQTYTVVVKNEQQK